MRRRWLLAAENPVRRLNASASTLAERADLSGADMWAVLI
jgi:hypothetical protein